MRATSTPWRLSETITRDIPSSMPCCSASCSFFLPISSCCLENCCWMEVISASIRSLTTPLSAIATPSRIPIARARKTEMREMRWYLRSGTGLDAQEEPQLYGEHLEDVGEGVGRVNDRRDRDERGDDKRDELPHGDARGVELADALGVHQPRPYLEARKEGRGGALAALIQELHEANVGADGHDQLRPALLGDQDGNVLREAGRGERGRPLNPCLLYPLEARGLPVRVGVDEHAVREPEALGGDRVHVAEDEVRLPAGLEQGVRPAVHPDDVGPHLPQVGPQGREVLAVVVAAHDDEHLTPAHRARQVLWYLEPGEEEVLLVAHELHGVLGEALQRRADHLPALAQPALRGLLVEVLADGDQLPVLVDPVAPELDLVPRRDPLEDLPSYPVQDVHPGARKDERPHVRVLAGSRARRVHHGVNPCLDQRLRRDPVEVLVVQDR